MDLSTRPRGTRSGKGRPLVALAVALAVWSAWAAAVARADLKRVREAVAEVERDTEGAGARLRALDSKQGGEFERLVSRVEMTAMAPPARVVADLVALMPRDVRLASLGLAYGQGVQVEVQVAARSARGYDDFLDRLVLSRRFTRIQPGDETREGEIQARIEMTWTGEAP